MPPTPTRSKPTPSLSNDDAEPVESDDAEPVESDDAEPVEADTEPVESDDVEVVAEEDALGLAEEAGEPEPEDDPWTRPGSWYVVHTQSGYEKKVTANLQARIQSMNMEDTIFEVVIPMEDVVEFKNGSKQNVQRKVFPGYILVRCQHVRRVVVLHPQHPGRHRVRRPGRQGQKPTPLARRDVRNFLAGQGHGGEQAASAKPKLEFEDGESVRVKEGPFADFLGQIAEINADHMKLKVLVNIFGRETLVEMDFSQVAKL